MSLRKSHPMAWLIAHEDIRQLASRYAVLLDARNFAAVAELFVPDVRVGSKQVGHDALIANLRQQFSSLGRSILQVTNHVIDVTDADKATGIVSCRAEIEPLDSAAVWVVQQIQYHDIYARVDDHWLFVRRKHLLWYGADILQHPNDLPDANWPANHSGKGELPEWYDSWQEWIASRR
ncbi:MAG: nuclear transport factor 2 family protein [Ilumatobacteraceae bacterium]|nr:nuclear transport factor 2 family protein [Ilumatobacteraceae bacterium]